MTLQISQKELSIDSGCACCTCNRKRIFVIVNIGKNETGLGFFARLPLPVLLFGDPLHNNLRSNPKAVTADDVLFYDIYIDAQ
jgi:hypothetical protein